MFSSTLVEQAELSSYAVVSSEEADAIDICADDACDQNSLEEVMYDNIDLITYRRKKSQVHFLQCRIIEIKVGSLFDFTEFSKP